MRNLLPLLVLSACTSDPAGVADSDVTVARDCVVAPPARIEALPPPVAIELASSTLWIWESLRTTTGTTLPSPYARVTRESLGLDGESCTMPEVQDSLLVPTADELAPRADGRRFALVPLGGVEYDGVAYLYYDHLLRGPGLFDSESLGTGLCTIVDAGAGNTCDRVTVADSTILWQPGTRVLDRGGFIDDNTALIAGCRKVSTWDAPCTITGVLVDSLRDPSAYLVFDGEGWGERQSDGMEVANSLGSLTIAPFGDDYIATKLDPFANEVVVQTSHSATDGYGDESLAFPALPPAEGGQWFVAGGREHRSLRATPRSIVVSYQTDNPAAPGLHLVDARFE